MAYFKYDPLKLKGKIGSPEHKRALLHFRETLKYNILGLQDKEWRDELEFILKRTEQKIRQVEDASPGTRLI